MSHGPQPYRPRQGSSTHSILSDLALDGPLTWYQFLALRKKYSSNLPSHVNQIQGVLLREGLIEVEVRLTEKGKAALEKLSTDWWEKTRENT